METYAYNDALAFESVTDEMKDKYDAYLGTYVITNEDLEKYARIVAYKVWKNLNNGFKMDERKDPTTGN